MKATIEVRTSGPEKVFYFRNGSKVFVSHEYWTSHSEYKYEVNLYYYKRSVKNGGIVDEWP